MNISHSTLSYCLSPILLLSMLSLGGCDKGTDDEPESPDESVFSDTLRFEGEVVEELPSGLAIRKVAYIHGRRFEWDGKAEGLVAEEEERPSEDPGPDIDALSDEELAEHLRAITLFRGHRFKEAGPAMDLAIEVRKLREMERREAPAEEFEKLLPSLPSSQGTAKPTPDFEEVERGEAVSEPDPMGAAEESDDQAEEPPEQEGPGDTGTIVAPIVHGADDRRVMNNLSYPHRTHIVFDNTGSTSSINGSQGSGTLIGPSTAMSVAHVFWHEANNTWEAAHRWAPGYDSQDSDPSPYGEWYGCYMVTIPIGYVVYESTTYDYAVLDFNVGCNSVRNGVNSDRPGSSVGWLGNFTASESGIESRTAFLRGYPGTGTCGSPAGSCNVRVWGDISLSSENDALSTTVQHQADSSGGQSGSGFYHYVDPSCSGCGYGPYVVGMHRAGFTSYNEARRYTSTVRSFMKAYSSDY